MKATAPIAFWSLVVIGLLAVLLDASFFWSLLKSQPDKKNITTTLTIIAIVLLVIPEKIPKPPTIPSITAICSFFTYVIPSGLILSSYSKQCNFKAFALKKEEGFRFSL
jgi:hypothetical protein